jgi:Yip1 domain
MGTMESGPPPAETSMGFGARLANIFISPGEVFADVVRRPGFWAPLIVLTVASVAVTETMLAKIGIERIIRISMEQSKQAANMSPEQMQQAIANGVKFGGPITHLIGFLAPFVLLLIFAGLGLLFTNAFFGAKVKFKTSLSVVAYGQLVSLLGSLMAIALILFGDPEHFNPNSPIPSNLGFFMNPMETSKPMLVLGSSLDIFYFWGMALWSIGLSVATARKVATKNIFLCYFGLWALIVLLRMGVAAL